MATYFLCKGLLQVLDRGILVGQVQLHHLVLAQGNGHLERHDLERRERREVGCAESVCVMV